MPHFRLLSSCALLSLGALAGCGDDATDDRSGNQAYQQDPNERARIDKGLQLAAPFNLNLDGKDRDLAGLGSYIVNAQGGCNDCHTNPPFAPGGDPFAGEPKQVNVAAYLRGGVPFGPTLVAPGIRPDAQGLPAGLSREAFIQLMRTGQDEGRILQVMPWPVYQDMTERDLSAIYEYLSALPQ